MVAPLINFESRRFQKLMENWRDKVDEEFEKQTAIYHGVHLTTIIEFTPGPKTQAKSDGINEKKLGERAIENDFRKIFTPLSKGDVSALKFFNLPHEIFNPSGDESKMEALHKRTRDKKGRVRNTTRVFTKRAGGKREFYNRMIVPNKAFNKYLKRRQEQVGKLKAAWISKIPGVNKKYPKWLTRHAMAKPSIPVVSEGKISYTTVNTAGYAKIRTAKAVSAAGPIVEKKFEKSLEAVLTHLQNKFSQMEAVA